MAANVEPRPKEIYKYLRPERVDVLINLKIRYTQPSAFNDLFECFPAVDVPTDIEFYREQFRQRIAHEISTRPYLNTLSKRKQYERLRRKDFRQFYERESDPKRHEGLGQHLQNTISTVCGYLSLSETNDNILMWGHYAESHKGFAIGFNWEHPHFKNRIHPIIYSTKRPIMHPLQQNPGDHLQTKSADWAYEKEWRHSMPFVQTEKFADGHTLIPFPKEDVKAPNEWPVKLFAFPKETISGVFLGWRANLDLRRRIVEALRDHGLGDVRIYSAKPDKSDFCMVLDPLGTASSIQL